MTRPGLAFALALLLLSFGPGSPSIAMAQAPAKAVVNPTPLPAPKPVTPPAAVPVMPAVVLVGPAASVPLGQRVFLDVEGTRWDSELGKFSHFAMFADRPVGATTVTQLAARLAVASPLNPPPLVFLFDETGNPLLLTFTPSLPGRYVITVAAAGRDAAGNLEIAVGSVTVDAGAPEPVPPIPPGPTPGPLPPPPGPLPPPGPTPVTGNLWAVLVLPDAPTPEQAALRTNAVLRSAFASANTNLRSYTVSETEVSSPTWAGAIQAAGGVPAVVWEDAGGKVLKAVKVTTVDAILSDLKTFRGLK